MPILLHRDDPDLLHQAIEFTARATGFNPRLIEKDYYCSVVLEYLSSGHAELIFKGATCLAKIHGSLYRLSENLDFSIATEPVATRAERSRSTKPTKAAVDALPDRLPGFRILEPLRGANNSTQYNAAVGYESLLLDGHVEPISIQVGVREPTLLDPHIGSATTALLNPVTGQALVDTYPVACLSYKEAMAEKLRAALCRREVAIRDFFDMDHAVRGASFDPLEPGFLSLLKRKLEIPGTDPADVSDTRMEALQPQLEAQLGPVLREQERAQFNLQRAVETVRRVAQELSGR